MKAKQFKKQFGIRAIVAGISHSIRTSLKGKSPEEKNEKNQIRNELEKSAQLGAAIRAEIAPTIEKEREAYERLYGKRNESQGFTFDLKKYAEYALAKAHSMGHNETDLATENGYVSRD